LLLGQPLLARVVTIVGANIQRQLLLGGAKHITIFPFVAGSDGEYVAFEVLAGPDFTSFMWC
jgi:hypothetical protein